MRETKKITAAPLSETDLAAAAGGQGGGEIASGVFSSDTGTALNLKLSWRAEDAGDGWRTLAVSVFTSSYSLNSSAIDNGVMLEVNGTVYAANSPEVNYQGAGMADTPLASFKVQTPAGLVSLKATWLFKGSYSGTALDTITVSGEAMI